MVTDNEGNPLSVTVSGEALPEGAYTIVSTAQLTEELIYDLGLDANSYVFDIKVYDKFNSEWQPKNGEVIKIKLPVLSENNSGVVNAIHILDNPEQIEFAINQGIAKITNVSEFSSNTEIFLEKAISAWQKVSRSSDKCAAAIVTSNLQVIDGYVEFESNGFSYYYWNNGFVESTSSGYDSNNKVKYYENIWGSSSWQNGTIYVTRSNIYVETAINNRANWTSSSSYVTLAEKGETNILNGKARWARFVVDSKTPVGTSFTITANDVDGKSNRSIEFVVIEDRTIYFNANGGTCSTTSAVGMTDGKTHHRPVSLPSPSRTGYTFDGWYSAASGGNYVGVAGGSYVPGSNGETIYAHWTPINYTIRYNANGGTGSMADQSATYDQKLNFAMNSFTHPTPGYVFAGWSTTPTGGVVYTNGAETINLTSKSEVVNLYAVWVNAMEITDIRIGVNESYWFTNYMYTVTADNVNTPSYHRFPAEPAQQSIRYSRAVDDANGVWRITENDVLYHNASYYINPSIVRSEYFEHSYITNQDTYGIADSTGVNTKAFLKFDDSDYQEIIKAWLKWMADSTSATPDANGEYTIVNKGLEYKTDINWKAEVNNWDEYEVIPYVIKLENSNAWRIDVVIAPTKLVTLSYNLNINTAAGYSLTGGSSIPNTQFERGSTQSVYSSVTSYNPNTKVSKNVGGVEYVAQFSHWEDEQGNKYGNGNSNSVLMDGNKTLKAIWIYPDQTQGALRIATDLTVPAGSGITPNMNQDFTLSVVFGTSGSYPYIKYSSTGLYQSNGTLNGTTGSFVLKPGEYVVISGVGSGVQYTVSESSVAGYTNVTGTSDGKIRGSIQAGNTMSATIVNQRNAYTVTWQNHNGTVLETDYLVEHGTVASYSGAEPTRQSDVQNTYKFTGWTPSVSAVTQNTTYVATYEATPIVYTVKFVNEGNVISERTYTYGQTIAVPSNPSKSDDLTYTYNFTGWTPTVSSTCVGHATYTAQYSRTYIDYTVRFEDEDGTLISESIYHYGDAVVIPQNPSKVNTAEFTYGFTGWSPAVADSVVSNATYKATYSSTKNSYLVSAEIDHGSVSPREQSVEYGQSNAAIEFRAADGYVITAIEINGTVYEMSGNTTTYTYPEQVVKGAVSVKVRTRINVFTVTWKNWDGTVLETDLRVEYGSTPVFNLNDPVRPSSIQYDYHFIGWTPEISPVVEETVYTAQYESTLRKYTVKWYDGNNRLLKTDEVEFGTVPVYSGELPQKDSTVQYDFTFNNSWDKEVVAVTGNVEYVAQFDPVVRKYTVQWWNDINQNGQIDSDEIIEMDTVEYGSKPSYDSDTPVLETDEQYIYTFTCWLDEQSNLVNDDTIVVGNTIYKASYDTELVKYTVTIVYDSDQVVLEDDSRFIVVDGKLQAEFDYGSVVGVELTAVEGYRISGVTLNDVDLEIVSEYSLIVEQDLELVVESELIQYQVHFDANGGTGEMDSVTLTYDEELTLPSCEFTRDNYVFKGWSLDEDAEEGYLPDEKIKNLTSIHGQEIVLYAIWGVDEITLTIVTECNDSDQTYLFEVAGTSFDGQKTIHLTIALGANDSQRIIGIPPGIYSITDQSGWSWRYDSQSYWNQEIHEDQTFTFSYLQIKNEKGYWLNDYSIKEKEIRE